ncbi:MAG: PilZ domain-containing protein [Deferrisomatales bacterium]|nr:PilZ domain-containing protein [Deferrisomatales bacterium]
MTGVACKPVWVTLLATALLFNTVAMPLQIMVIYGHTLAEWPAIWAKLTDCNRAVMLLSPLAALGAFLVCRWGWWAVLALLTTALVNNTLLLPFPTAVPRSAVLLSGALVLGTGVWLLRPTAVRLFWERRLQWWKTPPRHAADAPVEVVHGTGAPRQGRLVNISRSGAFVANEDLGLAAGDLVSLTIRLERRVIRCLGTVVRRAAARTAQPAGYGLQFQAVAVGDRMWLHTRLGRRSG